jgi:hypothetical protein
VEENICWLYIKGLITIIYRKLKNLNSPQINEPIKKWTTELNRTFSEEEIQMAKNCHSPAAAVAVTLVLGARVVNNDTNSGLCQAAMA